MIYLGSIISGLYGIHICLYLFKNLYSCPEWMDFYVFILGRSIGGIIAIIH